MRKKIKFTYPPQKQRIIIGLTNYFDRFQNKNKVITNGLTNLFLG